MRIYTIGFTQKPASRFFGLLQEHGIRRLVDIRLHNVSQLAGFAKRDDLAYFLAAIAGATAVIPMWVPIWFTMMTFMSASKIMMPSWLCSSTRPANSSLVAAMR